MFGTILVSLIIIGICALIIGNAVKNKKAGKSSCSCGCKNCAMSEICHKEKVK